MGRPKRPISHTELQALKKAVNYFGSISEMARQLHVSRQAVVKWEVNGIPAHHLAYIEKLTGISKARLRPDLRLK